MLPEWKQPLNMQLHIIHITCHDLGAGRFTLCLYLIFFWSNWHYLCNFNTATALPELHNIFTHSFLHFDNSNVLSCCQALSLIPAFSHVQTSEPLLDIRYMVTLTHTNRCVSRIIITKRNIKPEGSLHLHITTVIFSQQTSSFTYYS